MMSLKDEDAHADLTGVDDEHLKILNDWYDKLTQKYPTCGRVADDECTPLSSLSAAGLNEEVLARNAPC